MITGIAIRGGEEARLSPLLSFLQVAVLYAGGCKAPGAEVVQYTDQYTAMEKVCRWDEYGEWYADVGDRIEVPSGSDEFGITAYPSEACIDHVLADLGVDVDAFLEADDLIDPYWMAHDFGATHIHTLLQGPLTGIRSLVLMDYGSIEDYRNKTLVSGAYLDELLLVADATGLDSVEAAQYNFVTSIVEHVAVGEYEGPVQGRFNRETRTLFVKDAWCCGDSGGQVLLVHEATHVFPWTDHVDCDSESVHAFNCDEGDDAAYGFAASSLVIGQEAFSTYYVRDDFAQNTWQSLRAINDFNEGGQMLPEWKAAWESVYADVTR